MTESAWERCQAKYEPWYSVRLPRALHRTGSNVTMGLLPTWVAYMGCLLFHYKTATSSKWYIQSVEQENTIGCMTSKLWWYCSANQNTIIYRLGDSTSTLDQAGGQHSAWNLHGKTPFQILHTCTPEISLIRNWACKSTWCMHGPLQCICMVNS